MAEWKKVQDSRADEPKEIDAESSEYVIYERRNIRRETITDVDGQEESIWTYEQRAWPREDFLKMQQDLESPATRAIMQGLSDLQLEVAQAAAGLEV